MFAALRGDSGEINVVRMLTHNSLAPVLLKNFPEVLNEVSARLRLDALEAGDDPVLRDLLAASMTRARVTRIAPRRPRAARWRRSSSTPPARS